MATTTLMPPPAAAASAPGPVTYGGDWAYRLTVEQYERMIAAGALGPDDRVELLEGYLVAKMARDPIHDGTIHFILDVLLAAKPAGWSVRCQGAVRFADSQPEPDYAVVRGTGRDYLRRHPGPADIGLVVEVANTSLVRDLRDKARIYAAAGVPAYWVVNVADGQIEAFTDPDPAAAPPVYRARAVYRAGDAVPLELDGRVATVAAADLLP